MESVRSVPLGRRTYTPDVFVRHKRDGLPGMNVKPWLCEVKPLAVLRAEKAALEPKFRAADKFARRAGLGVRGLHQKGDPGAVLGERQVPASVQERAAGSAHVRLLLELALDFEETDPETLLRRVSSDKWERASVVPALWHLVATKRIGTDLTLPLTMRSRIRRMA